MPWKLLSPDWQAVVVDSGNGAGWDDFIRGSANGQFQQSTPWAAVKQHAGWNVCRVHLLYQGSLGGGFSLLWRRSRLGRIGYVSKGPVLEPETEAAAKCAVQALKQAAAALRLRGLVVQAPDESRVTDTTLALQGFPADPVSSVVDATLVLGLAAGVAGVENAFHKTARRNLRQAKSRGTTIRLGSESDLPIFFDLLSATCARRGTRPNPSSVSQLQSIWRGFHPQGELRLAFAECAGHIVAGTLTIGFGNRATLWKIGWNGTHPEFHPNDLLTHSEILWAIEQGYQLCDFGAIHRRLAEQATTGDSLDLSQIEGRYRYLLQFGGRPKLLPQARFYSPNRFIAWSYRLGLAPILRCAAKSYRFLQPGRPSPPA